MEIPFTNVAPPVVDQHNVLLDLADSPIFLTIAITSVTKQMLDLKSSGFFENASNSLEMKKIRERNNMIASTLIGAASTTVIKFFT